MHERQLNKLPWKTRRDGPLLVVHAVIPFLRSSGIENPTKTKHGKLSTELRNTKQSPLIDPFAFAAGLLQQWGHHNCEPHTWEIKQTWGLVGASSRQAVTHTMRQHQQQQREKQRYQQQQRQSQLQSQQLQHCTPRRLSASPADWRSATDGGSIEAAPSQQLDFRALALFAPSTRTPPPRRQTGSGKTEEAAPPWEHQEGTLETPVRSSYARDRECKPERVVNQLQSQQQTIDDHSTAPSRVQREAPVQARTRQQNQQQLQAHREASLISEALECPVREASGRDAGDPALPAVGNAAHRESISSQQQHQQLHSSRREPHSQQSTLGALESAVLMHHRGFSEDSIVSAAVQPTALQPSDQQSSEFIQKVFRSTSEKNRKERKGRDYAKRTSTACRHRLSEGLLPTAKPSHASPKEGSDMAGVLESSVCLEETSGLGRPLHARSLLELSPLLLAKVLQLLPAGAAVAFGSTCRAARQVLLSYCCIVSLSAQNVDSLLSLPAPALRRQLPLLAGLKTLEIELSPESSLPLSLDAAAAAAAATLEGSLESAGNAYDNGTPGSNTTTDRLRTLGGPGRERRQQHRHQARGGNTHQPPQGRQDEESGELENPSSGVPRTHRSMQGQIVDLLNPQSLPCNNASEADASSPAPTAAQGPISPWTTFAAASASLLLDALRNLKSITARLKVSLGGTTGDPYAATELILLLQALLHRNAQSLVSLKIAVDLPPSSVSVNPIGKLRGMKYATKCHIYQTSLDLGFRRRCISV